MQEKIKKLLQHSDIVVHKFNYQFPKLLKRSRLHPYVYFLMKDHKVIYVGQSCDIKSRFIQHSYSGKTWDSCVLIDFDNKKLSIRFYGQVISRIYSHRIISLCNLMEGFYIDFFKTNQKRYYVFERLEFYKIKMRIIK